MMNTVKKAVLITIGLFLIQGLTKAEAQDDRLMQDIRIGERVISEMINEKHELPPSRARNVAAVRGEYIDGYGVHFSIDTGMTGRTIAIRMGQRDEADRTPPVPSREIIESAMRDYLQNYSVLARNLSDNEQVRLTFGAHRQVGRTIAIRGSDNEEYRESNPRFTAWVSVADLKNHRDGKISDEELQNRIRIEDLPNQTVGSDLQIFASVLKAAIDNAGLEHLRINRDPGFDLIPGLGVHYNLNVNRGGFFSRPQIQGFMRDIDLELLPDFSNIEIDLGEVLMRPGGEMRFNAPQRIEFQMDSIRISLDNFTDSLDVKLEEMQREIAKVRERSDTTRQRRVGAERQYFRTAERDTVDYSEDVEKIMSEIKAAISDYGPTLRSLSDDEFLIVTINWRGRDLPEKTTFRIRKADLVDGRAPDVTER